MKYNILKCAVICTANTPTIEEDGPILDRQEISIVDSYKYLGFYVTVKGINFNRYIEAQITSAASFLKFV